MVTLLPQPLSPTTPKTWPGRTSKLVPSTARTRPSSSWNDTLRSRTESSGSVMASVAVRVGGIAQAVSADVRSEEAVQALFAQVEAELGSVEVCLFNAGANVKSSLMETSAKLFFRVWELACYGGF